MSIKSEEDFIDLVRKSERDAVATPRLYTVKLALFAVLGYVVIFAVLAALIGLAGGLFAAAFFSTGLILLWLKNKLIFAILIGIWLLMQALWVKFSPPQGYTLTRREYPGLFAELDGLSRRLDSLKIHEVILDQSLNAGVVQHPRLGVLGWHKNYLIVGYQLMLVLSPDEMRAVLAHEFGHLSGNHSQFSSWIYRVRLVWVRVMDAFDQVDTWGTAVLRRFFDWYSPHFEAYSFALARSNEYEADAIAADLTSPEVATRALVNVYATAPYLEEDYWNKYFRAADEAPEPTHAPFEGLVNFLRGSALSKTDMLEHIKKEIVVKTHYADTHPCLKDRIVALGAEPQTPVRADINAAEAWLGAGNHTIMTAFDQEWLDENAESWKQRYEYVLNARSQLKKFSQNDVSELSDQDLWDYACITDELISSEASLPLFQAYKQRKPEDPHSAYYLGHILLAQGDSAGLEHLRLAGNNLDLIETATCTGYEYLKQQGMDEDAEAWWQESLEQNEMHQKAYREIENVDIYDQLVKPDIDDKLLQELIDRLRSQKNVGKAWLAQKVVRYYSEKPVYVIAFSRKGLSFSSQRDQTRLAESLDIDGIFFVVCKSGDSKGLAKKVIDDGQRIL